MMRSFAWVLIVVAVLASLADLLGFHLPTISWAYNVSYETSFLNKEIGEGKDSDKILWFGILVSVIKLAVAILILLKVDRGAEMQPISKERLRRFKANKRGYISFIILSFVVFLASLDQLVVGKRALYVNYKGEHYFPAFERKVYQEKEFGISDTTQEVNYRHFAKTAESDDQITVILPVIPFDPIQDSVDLPFAKLETKSGLLLGTNGKPFSGQATTLLAEDAEQKQITYEYRKGILQGRAEGRTPTGDVIYNAKFDKGELVDGSEEYTGEGSLEEYKSKAIPGVYKIFYFPSPPMPSRGHYLGTTGKANDLVAYLYGGLQINLKATAVYIPAIFAIGISIGLLMGYFGGVFDLVFQRVIEIFSSIPFLFVVIIFSGMIKAEYRGLTMILAIFILFGWMGMTFLMRTAALKEKSRDYVAAARVMGASTSRIIFSHILPNTMSILVTLVPFSVASIVASLTALDYLGFGLSADKAATWGTLLKDGLSQYSKPWLVTSSFVALTSMLLLITFVGEAIRDAFDPKKFTTYK